MIPPMGNYSAASRAPRNDTLHNGVVTILSATAGKGGGITPTGRESDGGEEEALPRSAANREQAGGSLRAC
jgi:hypothetical protein